MPAEYQQLHDTEFELEPGEVKTFEFNLPNQVIRTGRKRPLVSFMVKPEPGFGPMTFDVDVNDEKQLHNFQIGSDEKGVFWEVINPDIALAGANTIQFRVVAGLGGKMIFSDPVIWYQQS